MRRFGISRARNLGLQVARHDWIVSLDSDCVPNPDYLRNLSLALEADTTMLLGERIFVSVAGERVQSLQDDPLRMHAWPRVASLSNYWKLRDRRFPAILAELDGPHPWAFAHAGNFVFARRAAQRIGGFDEAYDGCWGYEDIDFAHRLLRSDGGSLRYCPGIEAYHIETEYHPPDRWRLAEMLKKAENPNWQRICARIPGYEAYKRRQYAEINAEIAV